MLTGFKTYIGGFGLIFLGIGGLVTGKIAVHECIECIFGGLSAIGLRSFGERFAKAAETLKSLIDNNR